MSKSNRKVYRIKLTAEEREAFSEVGKGKRGKLNIAKWKVQRAIAMLKCPTAPILDGEKEAMLTKIACSTAPEGRSRWTLQLLADKLIELKVVETISDSTVGRVQKKHTQALA